MQEVLVRETMPSIALPPKNYEITRETAIAWRCNWEADLAESNPQNYVRSFRIDRAEIETILAVPGAAYIRLYFGRAQRGSQDKLILVAVDRNKKDMIEPGVGAFYDFTSPCPTQCDGTFSWFTGIRVRIKGVPPAAREESSPRESYEITRETAVAWRRNWEADLLESQPKNYVRSFRIDREELELILSTPGAAYMRLYFGRVERGSQDKLILVAVDRNREDIVEEGIGAFYDFTSPCPTACDGLEDWWS